MELKHIKNNVYYIPNRTNIGVIKRGNFAILIDTGIDDDTGKGILKVLEENGMSVRAIINTHSHADHCGGNAYIKEKTGAFIFAPELESSIIQYPFLEPLYIFSGASPLKELRNKFLMAKSSCVDEVILSGERYIDIGEYKLGIVNLKGHSPSQIGVEFDGVLFCADSVFSEETLKKHKIPFYTDIDEAKRSMEWLKQSEYDFYVPSHAEPTQDISDLVDANMDVVLDVENTILEGIRKKRTTEEIFSDTCNHYEIEINNTQQYYLMNTVIMAYLSSHTKRGKLKASISDNALYWERV